MLIFQYWGLTLKLWGFLTHNTNKSQIPFKMFSSPNKWLSKGQQTVTAWLKNALFSINNLSKKRELTYYSQQLIYIF